MDWVKLLLIKVLSAIAIINPEELLNFIKKKGQKIGLVQQRNITQFQVPTYTQSTLSVRPFIISPALLAHWEEEEEIHLGWEKEMERFLAFSSSPCQVSGQLKWTFDLTLLAPPHVTLWERIQHGANHNNGRASRATII